MVTVDRFVHVDVRSQYRILEHVATITQKIELELSLASAIRTKK